MNIKNNLESLKENIDKLQDTQWNIEDIELTISQNSMNVYDSVLFRYKCNYSEEIENALKSAFEKILEHEKSKKEKYLKNIKNSIANFDN